MKEQKKSHKGVSRTIRMKHNSSNFIIQDNRKPIFSREISSFLQQKEEKDSRYTQQSQNDVVQRYISVEGKKLSDDHSIGLVAPQYLMLSKEKMEETNRDLAEINSVVRLENFSKYASTNNVLCTAKKAGGDTEDLPSERSWDRPMDEVHQQWGQLNLISDCEAACRNVLGVTDLRIFTLSIDAIKDEAVRHIIQESKSIKDFFSQEQLNESDEIFVDTFKRVLRTKSMENLQRIALDDSPTLFSFFQECLSGNTDKNANPQVGQGYIMRSGGESYSDDDDWNFHWAGVIAESNDRKDKVTLENYAWSGAINDNWNFDMYGTEKEGQSFYDIHKNSELHGQEPRVIVVGGEPRVSAEHASSSNIGVSDLNNPGDWWNNIHSCTKEWINILIIKKSAMRNLRKQQFLNEMRAVLSGRLGEKVVSDFWESKLPNLLEYNRKLVAFSYVYDGGVPDMQKTIPKQIIESLLKEAGASVPETERSEENISLDTRAPETDSCCYLTTACVKYKGLDDDCEELTVLRYFRDTYLMEKPNGKAMIDMYYKQAPCILHNIAKENTGAQEKIMEQIYGIVRRCVDAINDGDNEFAFLEYCNMVRMLDAQYGS